MSEAVSADIGLEQFGEIAREIEAEVGKVIVGQEDVVERVLIGLLTRGHLLIEGVPGIAECPAR